MSNTAKVVFSTEATAPVPSSSPIQVKRKSGETASTPSRLVVRSSTIRQVDKSSSATLVLPRTTGLNSMESKQKKSRADEIAARAVREMALKSDAAVKIQRFYRNILSRRYFTRHVKRGIVRFQQLVRAHWTRKRFLDLSRRRALFREFIRPNEAVVLSSTVIKTSDVRSFRAVARQTRLKTLFSSKKVRQLVMTTSSLQDGLPRLFYIDPTTRTWKGEIPYDASLTSALTLNETEFLVFSRPNEEKQDKDPVWSFEVVDGSSAIEWIKAIRNPKSVQDILAPKSFLPLSTPKAPAAAVAPSLAKDDRLAGSISRTDSFTRMRAMLLPVSTRRRVVINSREYSRAQKNASLQGPLLMRELVGPKRYYQRYFALRGTTLLWSGAGEVNLDADSYRNGLTLNTACKVRLLSSPRLLPNLPNFAFWLYVPMREKPLKFRTMDLETAEQWAEKLGSAIAACETSGSDQNGEKELDKIRALLTESRDLVDKRSFLSAKVKLKEGLDAVSASRVLSSSSSVEGDANQALNDIEFELLELRARCNFVLGLFEKSLDDVNRALELVDDDEPCLRIKLASLERLERFDECIELAELMIAEFPTRAKELQDTRERINVVRETFNLEKKSSFNDLTALKKRPAIARQNSDAAANDAILRDLIPSAPRQTSTTNLLFRSSSGGAPLTPPRSLASKSPVSSPMDHSSGSRTHGEDHLKQRASSRLSFHSNSFSAGEEDQEDNGLVSHVARAETIMAKRLSMRLNQMRLCEEEDVQDFT